ncbi:hypothetical protein PF005_g9546 [Phytophthora fragariae]|uniref:Uncharacterized protein n=1 Tax=Phytophthora fragariae TaxID=53985 RepID=A0A6A3YBT7_9STRA|nr:hypothetical protein PF003_g25758 [Phytophthora fragariae]KAE9215157.1 hypothetical protein PF005_g9546 [Phytophthora fragariae]
MDQALETTRSFDEVRPFRSRIVRDEVNPRGVIPDGAQTGSGRSSASPADPASRPGDAGEGRAVYSQGRSNSRVPAPQTHPERYAAPIPEPPVNVEAIQAEAVRRAQEVAQAELDRRWQQQRILRQEASLRRIEVD